MDAITVLVTGTGAPGTKGTLYSLKNNSDNREIRIIGTDINEDVIGRYLCDEFYQIPRPSNIKYVLELSSICEKEDVDVLLPQNTAELPVLADHRQQFEAIGTRVVVSGKQSIKIANNKFELLRMAARIGVPVPGFSLVDNFETLTEQARKWGWPKLPVVVKPPVSHGMRGLRIIEEAIDLKDMFYSEKPSGIYLKMDNLHDMLGSCFPPLLVMEHLPGPEYTVDILNTGNIIVIPRRRDLIRSGVTFNGTIEKNKEIIEYSESLSREAGLKYAFGFQFKLDKDNVPKLLESNPRIQGTMILATLAGANIIYGAVKYALGETVPDFNVCWGTRIMRYWGGIGIRNDRFLGEL